MGSKEVLPHDDATSDATRLLCAGTYLDPLYRKSVIKELLVNRFRVVAPSYGYDTVSVLAHALAAHNLRRSQLRALVVGSVVIVVLTAAGLFGFVGAALLFVWLVWALAYLRRIATLQILATYLRRWDGREGFDGRYPATRALTRELVAKVAHEQESGSGVVFYGGYKPFVGAGELVRRWSNAELLIGAPLSPLGKVFPHGGNDRAGEAGRETPERKSVVPFTVDEITSYVAGRMTAELRDEAPQPERVEVLSVERRKYATALRTMTGASCATPSSAPEVHWQDDYDSAREYLCMRVGSWRQELVTSVFVGFDIKGNTLHTEFYTYVLPPIISSFHLVDRLPAALSGRLLLRVAWDVTKSAPRDLVRLITNPLRERLPRRLRRGRLRVQVAQPVDTSEFGLGRYALTAVNCGALASVREMATSGDFHHFFQESDTIKYTQIVERRLLHIVREFLRDHNVDLTDHDAQQTSILQQHFGHHNNFGPGSQDNSNTGNQAFGRNSQAGTEAQLA